MTGIALLETFARVALLFVICGGIALLYMEPWRSE